MSTVYQTPLPDPYPVRPLAGPPDARLTVPGSKSITNRALVLGALAAGTTVIEGALFAEDPEVMAACLRRLGTEVRAEAAAGRFTVAGTGGRLATPAAPLFVGNAGTAARFLTALATLAPGPVRLDGVPRMRERPIQPLLDALVSLGAPARSLDGTGCPPVEVAGGGLPGGEATLEASLSSQYLTALLLVGPYARRDVTVRLAGPLVARPYVDMTVRMMAEFGVEVECPDPATFHVRAGQRYRARPYRVEPDASSASYFFAAAAITGGRVRVDGLRPGSLQGDTGFVTVLEAMGCRVERGADWIAVTGPADGRLAGIDADLNAMSDMALTLAAIAPFAAGPVRIRGIGHTRVQETDRVRAVATELERLGVTVAEEEAGLVITPGPLRPATVRTYGDHRMAMAFSVPGLRVAGIAIADPGCVRKTFPGFFAALEALAGQGAGR